MNRKPLVLIPQEPMRKNAEGRWVSKGLDLASASEYGDTIIVWPPDTSIMSRELIEEEAIKLADKYDECNDYVVALGSPTLIALLAWAIGRAGKMINMLEWDRDLRRYYPTIGKTLYDVI